MSYEFIPSPNKSSRGNNIIKGVILHYTGGGDINGTIKWFKNPAAKASAHYVISRSGRIVQMVRHEEAAWHVGSSTTTPKINGEKHLNSKTIGIELCNWGPLYSPEKDEEIAIPVTCEDGSTKMVVKQRKAGEFYTWFRQWTYPYRGHDPVEKVLYTDVMKRDKYWPGGDRVVYWEPYSAKQMEALQYLMEDILSTEAISREWVTSHQEADPTRKIDPGPAFDMIGLLNTLFRDTEEELARFTVSEEVSTEGEAREASIEEMVEHHSGGRSDVSFFDRIKFW